MARGFGVDERWPQLYWTPLVWNWNIHGGPGLHVQHQGRKPVGQIMYEWKSSVQTHSKNRMRRNKKKCPNFQFLSKCVYCRLLRPLRELKWTTATSWILLQTYTHLHVNRLMKNFVLFCALMLIRDLDAAFFFFFGHWIGVTWHGEDGESFRRLEQLFKRKKRKAEALRETE